MRLKSIVHSETQGGKGRADIHFATAIKYVTKYIEEGCRDIVTPHDLVEALNHG